MGTQFARLVMAHMDCDTIPFFWQYASRFTIFDNIFATEDTPSTPNAIAMMAGQSGETQWVKHPSLTNQPAETGFTGAISGTINGITYTGSATTQGPPLVNDPQPCWGSAFDDTVAGRQPTAPHEDWSRQYRLEPDLRSLPLTMMGGWINRFTHWIATRGSTSPTSRRTFPPSLAGGRTPVDWRWYQNGYDREPTDTGLASRTAYVSHHNGAQYFGYIANNPAERMNLRGEGDFFADLANGALPETAGCSTSAAAISTSTTRNRAPPSRTRIIPTRRPDAGELPRSPGPSRATTIIRAIATGRSPRRWRRG